MRALSRFTRARWMPCIATRRFHCRHKAYKHAASIVTVNAQQTRTSTTTQAPEILPPEKLVDEEKLAQFKAKAYYPANPGDVLDQFRLISKLGWGSASTVWLAEDTLWDQAEDDRRYVAIKICTCDFAEKDRMREAFMHRHIATTDPEHVGHVAVGVAFGALEIMSPRGDVHAALLSEPLREPLWMFGERLAGGEKAFEARDLHIIKIYIQVLLEGLDFLHSRCHVIHTDLKADNIMMSLESETTLKRYVDEQATTPMARKHLGDYTAYRCHNDFGAFGEDWGKSLPKITDFGSAQRGDKAPVQILPIQPNMLRAPEVLLGIGWSYSADIWNFALLIWEFLAGKVLFTQSQQTYSAGRHLADMTKILGPIPPALLEREKNMRHWRWTPEVMNPAGKLCGTVLDYFEGPFFDDEGNCLHSPSSLQDRSLESEIPECVEQDAALFLDFMRKMLCWTPEDRATAAELIDHAWLGPCKWRRIEGQS